jgi:hypothetical protein
LMAHRLFYQSTTQTDTEIIIFVCVDE